ncbi:hypothetical protein K456DRAFT_37833 [Colletotrichum gloeosporioides 23]|nr:hypothetical protein K456DRAFT_37833 [Colletotrichum gloeosporioides 23]
MQQAVLAMSTLCLRLVGIRQVWQMSPMSSSDGCRGKKATSCCRVESNGCPSLVRRAVAAAKFPRTEGAGIGGGWDCPSERAGWAGWAGLGRGGRRRQAAGKVGSSGGGGGCSCSCSAGTRTQSISPRLQLQGTWNMRESRFHGGRESVDLCRLYWGVGR